MAGMTAITPSLQTLITRTARALARGAGDEAMAALETAIAEAVKGGDLLTPAQKESGPDGYRRHVLHVDESVPFTILSLVWRPGQATPVHGHKAWCAVGIAEGCLRVEDFTCRGDGTVEKEGETDCHAGQTCVEIPGDDGVHRLSNCGETLAVSIHVYGLDLRGDASRINDIFEDGMCRGLK